MMLLEDWLKQKQAGRENDSRLEFHEKKGEARQGYEKMMRGQYHPEILLKASASEDATRKKMRNTHHWNVVLQPTKCAICGP